MSTVIGGSTGVTFPDTTTQSTAVNPAGSTGQVQYNNSGVFGAVSNGTSGQVLTSSGSGVAPSWTTPSAGAMVKISTKYSYQNIQWTGLNSNSYSSYFLILDNINPGGSNLFRLQVGTGSSPTWVTSNYYYAGGGGSTYSDFFGNSNTAGSHSGQIMICGDSNWIAAQGIMSTQNVYAQNLAGGNYMSFSSITGIRITSDGGSFNNGSVTLYSISS